MHYTQHLLIDTQRYLDISMHRYSICSIDMHIELLYITVLYTYVCDTVPSFQLIVVTRGRLTLLMHTAAQE